jgi:hypothetical protein
MWRTFLFTFLTVPAGLLGFAAGWAARDLQTGLVAGAACFSALFLAAALNIFLTKTYTWADAALPVLFSLVWSLILIPFSFGTSLFSAPSFIGSAVLLSFCMVFVSRRELPRAWLITPLIIFLYEMLPLNIPGPFDDIFALAGSAGNAVLLVVKGRLSRLAVSAARHAGRKGGA